MDETQIKIRLEGLDEAGRVRALARLIKLVTERSDSVTRRCENARRLAIRSATQALKAAKIALISAKTAQKQGAPTGDTIKKLEYQERVIQQLLHATEAASKAADLLEPGRRKIEEHMSKLSRRERTVYPLLARGMTDKMIAKELRVSARTAQMHVTNIKSKLDIQDRDDFILSTPLLS